MNLLYADESVTANSSHEPFFVLAGFSIFECQTHWFDRELTNNTSRFDSKYFKQLGYGSEWKIINYMRCNFVLDNGELPK